MNEDTRSGRIEIDTIGAVGRLTIADLERRNAMSKHMYEQVPAAVAELIDAACRVIVVTGAGHAAFSAGSNIGEFPEHRMGPERADFDRAEDAASAALAAAPVPVIAAIHGPCRGGGLAIALACDLRVASDDATFAVPPARLGIAYPQAHIEHLVAAVGDAHARRLLLTAQTIDAAEAHRIGLVTEVGPAASIAERVDALAHQIVALAPKSLAAAKVGLEAVRSGDPSGVEPAKDACYDSADYREGVQAFLDKRTPRFTGG